MINTTKKFILFFLVVVLFVACCTACAEKVPSVTITGNSDPNSLSESEKEYILYCYNKEQKKAYGKDYEEIRLKDFDNKFCHYGTYDGNVVLFSSGMLMVEDEQQYGSYRFRYQHSFSIIVYKDGAFVSFEEAIDNGQITEENLAVIFNYHNGRVFPQYQAYDIDCPENVAPGELSEEVMGQFTAAFEKIGYNTELLHHYGTYNGVTLFYNEGTAGKEQRFHISVVFDHNYEVLYTNNEYVEMIVFKDGVFKDNVHYFTNDKDNISNLETYGLTEENVNTIAQYHESRLPNELKRVVIDCPENAEPATLSSENLDKLLTLFQARHDAEADTIRHYGTSNGIVLLMIYNAEDDPSKMDVKKDLVLYTNGNFVPVGDFSSRRIAESISEAIDEAIAYHSGIYA